ncbi:MAG: phenylalanine--tRNA ligase subunit beta [Elusimicrobia bacterium]|nr:phenylalanine--tRNA ligase subunit beta [Elusimicrobiota bacterium]
MRILYSWLKEYVDPGVSPEDLSKHLLLMGFEVAEIQTLGPGFEGVVIGEILEIGKHPNADRLNLCSVKVGGETLSIVCGAKNVAIGARVPVARIGAKLPGGRAIGPAKIRGTESQGMICSAQELGLPNGSHEGILILPADTPIGQDAAALLGGSDHALEVEITPNRPDLLSHFGLARELSIHFGLPLNSPAAGAVNANGASRTVGIEAKDGCGRYVGRDLTGVRVSPSPGWLAKRLEGAGLRPINSVVDVTNYVLFELGHPLHAFDADKLKGDVVVRRAKTGEKIKTLDGKEHALEAGDLVIADASGPIAIAGVIGGEATSVTDKTTKVFLEAANFDAGTVHRTARRLGIRTDSSYRFERGADPEAAAAASARAADLILQIAGGTAAEPSDAYPGRRDAAPISISAARINRILGSAFPADRVEALLKALATRTSPLADGIQFFAPSHRGDLATPWDLAEEVARHLGYDRIPSEAGPVKPLRPKSIPVVDLVDSLRDAMRAAGFYEAYNTDFVSQAQMDLFGANAPKRPIKVLNPIAEDQAYLRPSLVLGLLNNAVYNMHHGASGVRLFEIGRVYELNEQREPVERTYLAALQLGDFSDKGTWRSWRDDPSAYFYYAMKGAADAVLSRHEQVERAPGERNALFHPSASVVVRAAGRPLGRYGAVHPSILKSLGLERHHAGAMLFNLDILAALETPPAKFVPYSTLPTVVRDLSIVTDAAVEFKNIHDAIAGLPHVSSVELVDVYEKAPIPAGKRSLTLRIELSPGDKTLRDAEVQAVMQQAIDRLAKDCGAVLRG